MNKNLKFAEKYNWWSEEKWKISEKTKLSYIITEWSLQELYFIFKNFDEKILKQAFYLVKNDKFKLKPRRLWVIKTFFKEKKMNNL